MQKKTSRRDAATAAIKQEMLEAARRILSTEGYSALSTRRVASEAGVALSQIHYHFGTKEGLILALLDEFIKIKIGRQRELFETDLPLSQQWLIACDFFEKDLEEGNIRLLQECTAIGWTHKKIAKKVNIFMDFRHQITLDVIKKNAHIFDKINLGSADDMAELLSTIFMGSDSLLLLAEDQQNHWSNKLMRKFAKIIENVEKELETNP